MDYIGKPDLTADKLSKVFLVYESELVKPDPTGKRKHGVLNEARIRELAKQSRREGTAPFLPTSKAGLPKKMANY